MKWEVFTQNLRNSGIRLSNAKDKLSWSWNRSTGKITANLAYQCILYTNKMVVEKWWHKAIWMVKVTVKIICFMWICIEDRILTGINYQKRGGINPSVCALCLKEEESATHLFVDCQTTQFIWDNILTSFGIDSDWKRATIEENLKHWFLKLANLRHIPFLIMWEIWKYRNKILFENWTKNVPGIYKKISSPLKNIHRKRKQTKQKYY